MQNNFCFIKQAGLGLCIHQSGQKLVLKVTGQVQFFSDFRTLIILHKIHFFGCQIFELSCDRVEEKNGSYVWLWLTSAKEMEEKEGTISSTILFSLELLELNHKLTLREYQVKVLHALLKGTKSVFVSQPTGSGKICFTSYCHLLLILSKLKKGEI